MLLAYFAVLAVLGLVVWGVTGSALAGGATTVLLVSVLPFVTTALRASYQKRNGLQVRAAWQFPRSAAGPSESPTSDE